MNPNRLRLFAGLAVLLAANAASAHDPSQFGRMMSNKPMPTNCSELGDPQHYNVDLLDPDIGALKQYCDKLVAEANAKAEAEAKWKNPATSAVKPAAPAAKPDAKKAAASGG